MMNENRPLVCVRCFTYNQSAYIEETLNGFCAQQTDFPFVCCIVDDASTDGEQEVIKAYLHEHFELSDKTVVRNNETEDYVMSFARHKANRNCFFAVFYLKYNHYRRPDKSSSKYQYISEWHDNAKYIAICEGDDYWCHPGKLKMQVDFLESHEDYGLVHTDYDLTKGRRHHQKDEPGCDGNWFPRIIIEDITFGTLTVLYRKSVFDKIPKLYFSKNWPMGDKPLWFEMAHEAKIKYFPIVTARYRVLENSASHSNDINKMIAFKNAGVDIRMFYANYYGVQLDTDGYDSNYYRDVVRFACRLNEKKVAKEYYSIAQKNNLLTFKTRLFYVATIIPFVKTLIELVIKV